MFNKKIINLSICIVLLSAIFSGCIGPQAKEAKVEVPQEIVAGLGRDPIGVRGAHPFLTRVFEQLVILDTEMKPRPGLATRWEVSEDGLTWTIHLRKGVKFHDGTPFNAETAKFGLEWGMRVRPGVPGPVDRIEIVDNHTIKVIHREPYAPFVRSLFFLIMISPAAVDKNNKVIESIGTGPFMVKEYKPGDKLVLIRNENYWGGLPKLERVTLKFIPDPATRVMALEAGKIDMIIDTGGVLPEHMPTLLINPKIKVLIVPGAVPHYMSLNTNSVFLNDTRVRRAIMYAIDPASIIKYSLEGYGKVMTTVTPHSEAEWMHPEPLFQFNKSNEARKMLQEAGWIDTNGDGILEKDGKKFEITFLLSTGLVGRFPYDTIAEIVQAQLRDVGIMVHIEIVETGLWTKRLRRGQADISIRPWLSISPQTRLHDWLHSNGTNVLNMGIFYSNPEMDILIEKLMLTTDDGKAKRLAFEIQNIAARDVPIIPIYDEVLINAVRNNIRGYKIHPGFVVNWEDIYVVAK